MQKKCLAPIRGKCITKALDNNRYCIRCYGLSTNTDGNYTKWCQGIIQALCQKKCKNGTDRCHLH